MEKGPTISPFARASWRYEPEIGPQAHDPRGCRHSGHQGSPATRSGLCSCFWFDRVAVRDQVTNGEKKAMACLVIGHDSKAFKGWVFIRAVTG